MGWHPVDDAFSTTIMTILQRDLSAASRSPGRRESGAIRTRSHRCRRGPGLAILTLIPTVMVRPSRQGDRPGPAIRRRGRADREGSAASANAVFQAGQPAACTRPVRAQWAVIGRRVLDVDRDAAAMCPDFGHASAHGTIPNRATQTWDDQDSSQTGAGLAVATITGSRWRCWIRLTTTT